MPSKSISEKLSELANRAETIKKDPQLRHFPNKHDVQKASENAQFMQPFQYQAMQQKGSDA